MLHQGMASEDGDGVEAAWEQDVAEWTETAAAASAEALLEPGQARPGSSSDSQVVVEHPLPGTPACLPARAPQQEDEVVDVVAPAFRHARVSDLVEGNNKQFFVPWRERALGRITPWKSDAISCRCMLHPGCTRIYSKSQLQNNCLGDGMDEVKAWLLVAEADNLSKDQHQYMAKPLKSEVRQRFAPAT